jgi:arylsulfatase A-like enzyme
MAKSYKDPIKNVVLISFDSLRSDYIAKANAEDMPFFCRARDNGVYFRNVIVQAPFTVPSHMSMLTGLYPAKTGVRDIKDRPSSNLPTILDILKRNEFTTILSSRTGIFRIMGITGVDKHVPLRHKSLLKAMASSDKGRLFAFLHYWGTHTPYETRLPGLQPINVLLNILRPLDRFNDKRFLRFVLGKLWLLRVKRIRAMLKQGDSRILPAVRKGYKNALKKADRFIGVVLDILQAAGIAGETLIVITGDHGDSFNEHGEIRRAVDNRHEHGQFLYDNVIKVLLIFFLPKRRLAKVFDGQVQLIDIMPTMLETLGVDYTGALD